MHRPKPMTTKHKIFLGYLSQMRSEQIKLSSSEAVKFGKMGFHTVIQLESMWSLLPNQITGLQVESNSISIRGISEFIFQETSLRLGILFNLVFSLSLLYDVVLIKLSIENHSYRLSCLDLIGDCETFCSLQHLPKFVSLTQLLLWNGKRANKCRIQ